MNRRCSKCKQYKPADLKHFTDRGHGRLNSRCRVCHNAHLREKYKTSAAYREYYQESNLLHKYGLAKGTYDVMFRAQDGKCAICRSPDPKGKGRFRVDHCHATGRVRGLLCQHCNTAIGLFKEDNAIFMAAVEYLKIGNSL